ncbi:probable pH-response regulator palA protein [Rhynchosporium agropyri]|uniref:Probable pH-response regulator palA protein n=1 Tax=Rhynchosporium agropyri TaxID=914238 RepID=A0A1E1K115_9HELO|nr:probable pH-response regulator palA protein [Rhynchosporium agropyri]
MASNIISLPFRKTNSVSLSEAIKQYISSKYDQHPDMFKEDLEVIDALRRDAVFVREPHISGIKKISAYAGQLAWMGGKFPIDIGVDFTWYPALGYNTERPNSQNNLKFELANVLYNLAALYSQLAMSSNRGTTEGLRSACNYFCLATGVISHIKNTVIPELRSTPPEDMDDSTLESLQQLLLAQGQECFWQKAVMDGYKDASIAKLAAKVSDFYGAAGDWGVKSEAISSEWIHHTTAKHHHFAAAAQYRQACDCLEKRKYGEEVARLRDSISCVEEALKEAKYLNKVVLGDLNGLKNKVTEDLKRAEKDNDLIYLSMKILSVLLTFANSADPVPPKSELKTLERAAMAVAKVPKEISDPASFIGDKGEFGPPLFAKLVPFAVHVAASIYEERRDRVVNTNIVEELEILTTKIHDTLSSLNLPGSLQALEKPLGLPPTLTSHAEEIRQADALNRLQRSFSDTAKLKASDDAIFAEGRELLLAEKSENERLLMKYGSDRWTRLDSQSAATKLFDQIGEIDNYLKSANNSDQLVISKFRECEDMLRVLSSTDRDIGNFVPSSRRAAIPPKIEGEVSNLRNCLNELSRLEARRRRKIEALREKAKKDDINSSILAEAARLEREYPSQIVVPAHFEDFFEQRLTKYDADIDGLKKESDEQDRLTAQLEQANQEFVLARKGDTSSREREQALQKLENAYFKYKEIVSNLEVGRKFYNDLAKIVGRFRDGVRSFVYERREEAIRMENDLSLPPLSSLTLRQQQEANPPVPRTYNVPSQPPPQRAQSNDANENDIPAPVPQRARQSPPVVPATWNPEMGIKFGGATAPAQDANANGKQGQQGWQPAGVQKTWDPNRGFKFG